ncbi:hypothetical protein [Dactylosporangium sp. CA-139066]|uniref:hypothetical protein n=1 Tax=Dactylosporangium sp. CA-139066 TaxID=3239930 RepID=UPI003D90A024
MIVLANARVVTPRRVLDPGWLVIDGATIAGVGAGDPPAADGERHDLERRYVLPGFVDLHMHGGGGAQITTDDPDEILAAIAFHQRHGTTRTLASLVTDELDRMAAATRTVAGIMRGTGPGPIVGVPTATSISARSRSSPATAGSRSPTAPSRAAP